MNEQKPNITGLLIVAAIAWWAMSGGGPDLGGHQKPSVFVVMESAEKPGLPASMVDSWYAGTVREYAAANWDDFLVIDKTVIEASTEPEHAKYRDVLREKPPGRLPCLYVSNGKHGAAGDPPLTADELIAVGKKYE